MEPATTTDLDRAELLLGSENDTAIDIAMASLLRGEDVARASLIAAEGFDDKGMDADALTFFDRSIAAAPSARAYAGRGVLRRARGEIAEAAEDFERALAIDPTHGLALLGHGALLAAKGDTAAALATLTHAAEAEKYRSRALVERAKLHLAADRTADATRDLLLAADLGHSGAAGHLADEGADTGDWSGEALLALARYYRNLEEPAPEEEASATEGAIEKLEGKAKQEALLSLGRSQRSRGAYDDAIATYRRAAALEPNGPAPAEIARVLFYANRNREAEAAAREVLAGAAEPFEAHRTLGELMAEEERFEDAIVSLDRALALAPPYAVAVTQLLRGRVLLSLEREAEARAAFIAAEEAGSAAAREERREHFPAETASDFFDEALEHMNDGEWESAQEPLERAADLFRAAMRAPGDFAARQLANVLTNLGNVHRQAGDIDAALRVLEEATAARPTGFEAFVMFGNVLRNAEIADGIAVTVEGEPLGDAKARLRKSIDLYDRAVSLAHGSPYAHYNRGLARQTAGRWREAVEDFERALAYADPSKRQDAVFNIVKSTWKAGEFEAARQQCESLETNEDIETATRKNIEALVMRQPRYEGDIMLHRFGRALETLIELGRSASSAAPGAFPFRFYGVRPEDCAPGSNMGHRYRLRFREVPDGARRERLAAAVTREWAFIDDGYGSTWRWSGPFVEITIGELESAELDGFFDEVIDLMKTIHDIAPLDEVVSLNAQSLSSGSREEEEWERWSLTVAPLPTPHPFSDDGALFFSAYGEVGAWPAPTEDAAFDALRAAARRTRDGEDDDDDSEEDEEDADGEVDDDGEEDGEEDGDGDDEEDADDA